MVRRQLNRRNSSGDGRTVRVTALLLADRATVREGLLHVLGAGITRIVRDPLPARLDVALAVMFRADDEADLVASHKLEVSIAEVITRSTSERVAKADMELFPPLGQVSRGPNLQVPVVVPIQPIPVPENGLARDYGQSRR